MTIERLNDAKVIILNNNFCTVVVDKEKHSIVQTRKLNKEMNEDITEICEQMESKYTIGDMVVETPYTGGMIMSKLLNNCVDRRCMKFINNFNVDIK